MKAIEQALAWYGARPTWGKILLAIPLVLLLVGIVVLVAMTAGRFGSGSGDSDPLGTAKDLHEEMIDAELETARKRDEELSGRADAIDRELDELDADAAEAAKAREKDHDAIDNADSIADVDRALRDR